MLSKVSLCACLWLCLLVLAPSYVGAARGRTHWPQQSCEPCSCSVERRSRVLRYRNVKTANCSSRGLVSFPNNLPYDLEELYLDGNNFSAGINDSYKAFWTYNATKVLSVKNSRLYQLPSDLFRNATKLQHLDLTDNCITSVSEEVFQPTTLLVDILGLDVDSVPPRLFHGLNKLRKLELTLRKGTLPVGFLENSHLQVVELSLDEAIAVPVNLFHGGNSTLREINFYGKKIRSIPEGLFKNLAILHTVKLRLPSALTLPENLFQASIAGEEVYHLKEILVKGVDSIPENIFQRLSNLQDLSLHQVKSIPSTVFRGLTRLRNLDCSYNQLTDLVPAWFRDLGSGLQKLDLSHNKINYIGRFDLEKLKDLQNLDLSHNILTDLDKDAFDSFRSSVAVLDLSHNQICQLPEGVFHSMWALKILKLNMNCLATLKGDLFGQLETIKELHLQDNKLRIIPSDLFVDMVDLEVLNLRNNQIQEMPIDSVNLLTSLTVLDISNNSIGPLPEHFLPNRPLLKEIYLGKNPLHCDCGIVHFTVLFKLRVTHTLTGICQFPPQFRGKTVNELNIKEVCPDTELLEMLATVNPTLKDVLAQEEADHASTTGPHSTAEVDIEPESSAPGSTVHGSVDTEATNSSPKGTDPVSTVPQGTEPASTVPEYTVHFGTTNNTIVKVKNGKEKTKVTFKDIASAIFNIFTGKGRKNSENQVDKQQGKPIAEKMEGDDNFLLTPLFMALATLGLVTLAGLAVYKITMWRRYAGSYTVNRI